MGSYKGTCEEVSYLVEDSAAQGRLHCEFVTASVR